MQLLNLLLLFTEQVLHFYLLN